MSEAAPQPEPGRVWCFVLEPADRLPDGRHAGDVAERLAAAVRAAEARGMTLAGARLAFVTVPAPVPGEVRVRGWLKQCLRQQALRARWPVDRTATPAAVPPRRRVRKAKVSP